MTNQSSSTCVPREEFSSLSPEVKQILGKIPNNMKAIISCSRTGSGKEGATNHSKNGCKSIKPLSFPPRKFTKAHLHELFSKLISETSLSDDNEPVIPAANQDSKSALLVNSASANTINPGDIRKLMSAPGKTKEVAVKK